MNVQPRDRNLGVFILFSIGVGVVLLSATSAVAATKTISIMNITYNPSTATIHVGDKVIWSNDETGLYAPQHTATSDDGHTFDSGYIDQGHSFSFTFTTAGTFHFHCNVHSNMHGTITVLGSSPSPTPTHATPTPTPTHSKPKPSATATAKPAVVPVSPTPTPSVKPSPRASGSTRPSVLGTQIAVPTTSTIAASGSAPRSTSSGVLIGLIAGAIVILGVAGTFVLRARRTDR